MTPIADMVRQMLEKGVAHDAILIAIEGAELALMSAPRPQTSADMSADRRREKDRLRKQAVRGNPQTSAEIRGNPQTRAHDSLSNKEEILTKNPSLERGAHKTLSADKRGHRLPSEWQPQAPDWAEAQQKLGPRAWDELAKFRDYWKAQPGQRGVKVDWDATWRNWARRATENGHGKTPPDNPRSGSLLAALDRALEQSQDADLAASTYPLLSISKRSI